jgi:hypothetical protein
MRFWDASAIIPLCINEENSRTVRGLVSEDGGMVAWWGSSIECFSALARLRREGLINTAEEDMARNIIEILRASWTEILPGEEIRSIAGRLLLNHPLKAADSLQLAAAIIWAEKSPSLHPFVCFDNRLREAARKEGFMPLPGQN